MRIVHCLRAPVGGLFRHVLDLASEQAARGHDVGLNADAATSDALTESKLQAIAPRLSLGINRVAMSRQPGLGDIGSARAVAGSLKGKTIDVLHGHGAKGGAYARLASPMLRSSSPNLKVFYTPHGGTLHYAPGSLQGRAFFAIERWLGRMTSGFIFESAYAAGVFNARVGKPNAPQRIIPNGLQPTDFDDIALADDATDLLYIGELRHLKGVDVLLQALADVRARHPVTLTIVGSGPDEAAFKTLCSDLGLDDAVRFTGALPAREAFKLGTIGVVPSRAESFPYIVLEMAAVGRPLLATNVGGIPEIVAGTDTVLVPPGDVAILAARIADLVANPVAAGASARQLRANVADKFSVAAMTRDVLAFYALTNS